MKRTLAILSAAFALAAGCGQSQPDPPPAPSHTASPRHTASPTPNARSLDLEVWFTEGEHLVVVSRRVPETKAVGTAALNELVNNPEPGLGTAIETGTRFLGLTVENGVATARFSSEFLPHEIRASQRLELAQVVFTLTQFPTVQSVNIEVDGQPVGEPGLTSLTRVDFLKILPPILVETPAFREVVSSPLTVSGTADVFEATVSIRILDGTGNVVGHAVTTASCGTGCRGDYSTDVEYTVGDREPGTIEVYEASAENGEHINVVQIPVILTP